MDLFEIAQILSKREISYLVRKLIDKKENVTRIAKKSGLNRGTIYKYLNNKVKTIKEDTKAQILGVSLLYNKEFTLNFILNRLEFLIATVAYSSIENMYAKFVETQEIEMIETIEEVYYRNKVYLDEYYQEDIIYFREALQSFKEE